MCTQIGCYRVNPHLKHPRDKQNKRTNGPCTAAYLAIYSFRQVIRADPTPVFGRKIHVSQGFANAFLNLLGWNKSFISRSLAAWRESLPDGSEDEILLRDRAGLEAGRGPQAGHARETGEGPAETGPPDPR